MTRLDLLATNNTDRTITVAVDGVRYEYWIREDCAGVERACRVLIRREAFGKALNLLKARAWRCDKAEVR